jgi:ATP-binding cassette subfamily B protein/ATP-binding cassette subfamily C protein/ATP-binding cassette subfamily B multidrug efflux pump
MLTDAPRVADEAPEAPFALHDISIALAPGATLGIVGPTGAGKSTLLALLLRHYRPSAGRIAWAGTSIDDYQLAALRAGISWVPQEPFLFSASIAENIALARPDASRAEIEHAAELAALSDDVRRFADGYDTLVGERGVTLSGGQKQRVSLARALHSDRPALLLDDTLSAIDPETERRIVHGLRQRRAGRTMLIASHRLSVVADADLILVLEGGAVREQGTHRELVALGGSYAAAWRRQSEAAMLAGGPLLP